MQMEHRWQRGLSHRRINQKDNIERLANGLGWFSIGLGLAELMIPKQVSRLVGIRDTAARRKLLRMYGARELAAGIGILSQTRPEGWLWARVAGDGVDLASLGTAYVSSDSNRKRLSVATAAVAGVTAMDIYCAQQLDQIRKYGEPATGGRMRVERSVLIDRSPEEVYKFWRNLENLPTFMNHLESVQVSGERRSHWKVKAPAGGSVEWDAEIVEDQPNSLIAWRSVGAADVEHNGTIRFDRATGGRGTLVRVDIEYAPPGGVIGAAFARVFGEEPEQQLDDDLRAFKQIMETGEVIKSDSSIYPGMHPAQPPAEVGAMNQPNAGRGRFGVSRLLPV